MVHYVSVHTLRKVTGQAAESHLSPCTLHSKEDLSKSRADAIYPFPTHSMQRQYIILWYLIYHPQFRLSYLTVCIYSFRHPEKSYFCWICLSVLAHDEIHLNFEQKNRWMNKFQNLEGFHYIYKGWVHYTGSILVSNFAVLFTQWPIIFSNKAWRSIDHVSRYI